MSERQGVMVKWITSCPALFFALLSFATVAGIYVIGLMRGIDHHASWGPDTDQRMIAIAISDHVYHLNLGYVAYGSVYRKLVSTWEEGVNPKLEIDPTLRNNGSSSEILNKAITEAASLGPQVPGYFNVPNSFITGIYNDLGYSDFVNLSFKLFGLYFESMYYTFFVIIIISAVVFLVSFRRDPIALTILPLVLAALLFEPFTGIFDSHGTPSYVNPRHGVAIALLPAWHIIMLLWRKVQATPPMVAAALFQSALVAFGITIRASTVVIAVSVFAITAILGLIAWWRLAKAERSAQNLGLAIMRWPAIVFAVGLFLYNQGFVASQHMIYHTDEAMPYHEPWLVFFLEIIHNAPELSGLTPEQLNVNVTEGTGLSEGWRYMQRVHYLKHPDSGGPAPELMSSLTEGQKFKVTSIAQKRAFIEQVKKQPLGYLKFYLLKKPVVIVRAIWELLTEMPGLVWPSMAALSLIIARVAQIAGVGAGSAAGVVGLGFVAVFMTSAPAVLAVVMTKNMPEMLLSLIFLLLSVFWAGWLVLLQRWRPLGDVKGQQG